MPKPPESPESEIGLGTEDLEQKPPQLDVTNGHAKLPKFVFLDGKDAGYKYGDFKRKEGTYQEFRARGIEVALRYLKDKHIKAKATFPKDRWPKNVLLKHDIENRDVIKRLKDKGSLILVPDKKQHKMLRSLGMRKKCYVLSNARSAFRDRDFVDNYVVPFCFIRDEFLPNPDPRSPAVFTFAPKRPKNRDI